MTSKGAAPDRQELHRERWELLGQVDDLLETPMIVLSFVWLGLMILDFTTGLSRSLEILSYAIWALFILQFLLGIVIAPSRAAYLRRNWLTAIALLLPAFRVLRVFRAFRLLRAARAIRSVNLVRVVATLNRGMRAVGNTMGRRGIGYVAALTVLMTLGGAAGMAAFENPWSLREAGYPQAAEAGGLDSYGEALWWTAMIMTTMGSEYWPKTVEGRILGWLLAMYAFAVFGYITATIASVFIAQDAAAAQAPGAKGHAEESDVVELHQELATLRSEIAALTALLATSSVPALARSEERSQGRS